MMAHEFNLLRRILKERSGIDLGEDKMDLVEAKIRPVLKEFDFPSVAHLTLALMKPDNDRLRLRVAQAIAVLESYFFRDKAPFQYFTETMLPRLMERRAASRRIRIWCAASSTGQEPYSLAMLLCEEGLKLDGWTIEIVATDFSEDALRKARKGLYSQFEVQRGLPVWRLVKFFHKSGTGWQIKPEVQDRVEFREHNLLNDCQGLGRFDIIFCRNVLIYFGEQLKTAVLARLEGQLAMDGYLVLGAAETTTGMSPDFMPVPEGVHGIFCLTPDVAALRRQARLMRGLSPAGMTPGTSAGIGAARPANAIPAAADPSKGREVRLDPATAELLEARARVRGLTLAEYLVEIAASETPEAGDLPGLKAGRS
jgi:chemotaxis protein methyltransferase CheR